MNPLFTISISEKVVEEQPCNVARTNPRTPDGPYLTSTLIVPHAEIDNKVGNKVSKVPNPTYTKNGMP
jgi:hypothetical protein